MAASGQKHPGESPVMLPMEQTKKPVPAVAALATRQRLSLSEDLPRTVVQA